ncbi:Dedicator of cytokinesis protein 4 [Trichoplax sp. H2]|nr:Dedicator of cytokinesis protein 4 [Trichoplax sp. H2]|eukprot:RDD44620.1 Dedicator of cytokinesis protein 4 [Trichoplax sp. H2]
MDKFMFCKVQGRAIHPFDGSKILHGINIDIGDRIIIESEYQGWIFGEVVNHDHIRGIFPKSHVEIIDESLNLRFNGTNTVADEIVDTIRDWSDSWDSRFKNLENRYIIHTIGQKSDQLIKLRDKILDYRYYSQYQVEALKKEAIQIIDDTNKNLNFDVIPRKNNLPVKADNLNLAQLYTLYREGSEKEKHEKKAYVMGDSLHILIKLETFQWTLSDTSEVIVRLYDAEYNRFTSDSYVISLTEDAQPTDPTKIGNIKFIFTEILYEASVKNLYVVFRVIKKAPISKSNAPTVRSKFLYRQPYGCAVCSVAQMVANNNSDQLDLTGYTYENKDRDHFANYHEMLIEKLTKDSSFTAEIFKIKGTKMILPGDFHELKKHHRLEFSEASIIPNVGYLDWKRPGLPVNELFVTVIKTEIGRDRSSESNIEMIVSLISKTTKRPLPGCFSQGANSERFTSLSTYVIYHDNDPQWKETFKITIPNETLDNYYLKFEVQHRSSRDRDRAIGISYLKLLKPNGTVLNDGVYMLKVHKDKGEIVSDEVTPAPKTRRASFASKDETTTVSIQFRSTQLTQDVNFLRIFNWRNESTALAITLETFSRLKEGDLLKFATRTLNSLLELISESKSEHYAAKAMECLVILLSNTDEADLDQISIIRVIEKHDANTSPKFLDTYTNRHITTSNVYRYIFNYIMRRLDLIVAGDLSSDSRNDFKMIPSLLKIMVSSYFKINADPLKVEKATINKYCSGILKNLLKLYEIDGDHLNDIKAFILSHYMEIYHTCKKAYGDETEIISSLLAKMHNNKHRIGEITQEKLNLIAAILNDKELLRYGYETRIVPDCLGLIHDHIRLSLQEEKNDVLDIPIHLLELTSFINVPNEGHHYHIFNQLQQSITTATKAIVVFLGTLQLSRNDDIFFYLSFQKREEIKERIALMFLVFKSILEDRVFPKEWFYFKLAAFQVIIQSLGSLSKAMTQNFLQKNYNHQIWDSYFFIASSLILANTLQLESFSTNKRNKILETYGDLRIEVAKQIAVMWELLAYDRKEHIPAIIGTILELSMVPVKGIFPSMISLMLLLDPKVEIEALDKTHELINSGKGDYEYREIFYDTFTNMLLNSKYLDEHGRVFVNNMTDLIDKLLDYRYLNKFYQEQLKLGNFVEAGYTLLHYSNKLTWSNDYLPDVAHTNYKAETEEQRKEKLNKMAVDLFIQGESWESAMSICRDLVLRYQNELDLRKLSGMLKKYANIVDKMLDSRVVLPYFYHVGFYGLRFPKLIQNKTYIYSSSQAITDFCSTLQIYFPEAQLLQARSDPTKYYRDEVQYIQIMPAKPVIESKDYISSAKVEETVKRCFKRSGIDTFEKSVAVQVGKTDSNNVFKSLGLIQYRLKIEKPLPGLQLWFEVIDVEKKVLQPLEHAVVSLQEKLEALEEQILGLENSVNVKIEALTLALQGTIIAPVNGGLGKYQEAFICQEYLASHINDIELVVELYVTLLKLGTIIAPVNGGLGKYQEAFICQEYLASHINDIELVVELYVTLLKLLVVLENGLIVQERLITNQMKPLHDKMWEAFQRLQQDLEKKGEFLAGVPGSSTILQHHEQWLKRSATRRKSSFNQVAKGKISTTL